MMKKTRKNSYIIEGLHKYFLALQKRITKNDEKLENINQKLEDIKLMK